MLFTLKIEIRPHPILRTDTRKSPTEFIAAHIYFALKVYMRKKHTHGEIVGDFSHAGCISLHVLLFMVRLSFAIYLEDSISALGFSRLFPFDIRLTNVPPFHVWHISSRNLYIIYIFYFACFSFDVGPCVSFRGMSDLFWRKIGPYLNVVYFFLSILIFHRKFVELYYTIWWNI